MSWNKREFERAVRWGSDEEIRDAARNLDISYSDRKENAEFMAETLKKYKFGSSRFEGAEYDGVRVRTGTFPRIDVDAEIPERKPEKATQRFPDLDNDDDDDEEWDDDDE